MGNKQSKTKESKPDSQPASSGSATASGGNDASTTGGSK